MTKKDKLKKQQQDEFAEICKTQALNPDKMLNLVRNEKDKRLLRKRINIQKIIENTISEEALLSL